MRIKAAVLHETNQPYSLETVELDPPKRGEVLVKIGAAGVCRSDLHFQRGDAAITLPAVLGHEGSGTVEAVGDAVTLVEPGDRVILSFVPNCGHCYQCEMGRPNLCDAHGRTGGTLFDKTVRLHTLAGQDIAHMGKVACFGEYAVVPESGCIPVPDHPGRTVDFPQMALIGCSVTTGVGAALFNAHVGPGDAVAVATHTVNPDTEDAVKRVIELTSGGANFAFEAYGGGTTTKMAVDILGKRGTAVIVGIAPLGDTAAIEPVFLTRMEKSIRGSYYGSSHPRQDMPRILDWYQRGLLEIDGLITRRYRLDDINQAYEDLESDGAGRGVIVF